MPTHTLPAPRRDRWTKKARAVFVPTHGLYPHAVKLMGPSDGTGCLPPGETKVHQTRNRSTKQKAIDEAIAFCDTKEIRIREFPAGFAY